MNLWKYIFGLCFVVLIGVPVLFRPAERDGTSVDTGVTTTLAPSRQTLPLIIITPHNEQIRYEFKHGFEAWHARIFGQRVNVIYNVPGGTSEIRRMLEAQFLAAIEAGRDPGGDADLVFGGGTFEHGRLKRGVRIISNGQERFEPITTPVDFPEAWLNETFGENRIGDDRLYDPDKHWFGVALSGFGIVFNRDVLASLRLNEPRDWSDLCDPSLQGWIALVNPNQSGSVTTAFESIFKRVGWEQGWRILRRAGANSRYFSASSLKPPIDVSQGNAAMGVCIDFFGRFQSQALKEAGDAERVGYVDPPGVPLDADPISMLRNAPQPVLAKRFIEFCLSEEGQALWQFPKRGSALMNQGSGDQFGPEQFELRRMPIVRSMYAKHFERFIDRVNPFELAQAANFPDVPFRDFIAPMFAAMVMDTHHDLKDAWRAIASHPEMAAHHGLVDAEGVGDPTLQQMLRLFDAMPEIEAPGGGKYSLRDATHLSVVKDGWLLRGWKDQGLWHREASPADEMRKRFGAFFRANYRRIVELAEGK